MQSDQTHLLNNFHQIAAVNDLFVTDTSPLWSRDAKYIKGRGICVPILSRWRSGKCHKLPYRIAGQSPGRN